MNKEQRSDLGDIFIGLMIVAGFVTALIFVIKISLYVAGVMSY